MRRLAVLLLTLALVSPTVTFSGALASDNPRATLFSPTENASVPLNEPLLAIGGAFNGEAGGITEVEISTDDGATWTSTDAHTERWAIVITPTTPGPLTIHARANTASTTGPVSVSRTVQVGGTTTPPFAGSSLFFNDTPEPDLNDPDTAAVELGLRFKVDRDGSLTGMGFRRGTYTGPVTAHVWSADGTLLASQAATGQQTTFTTPIPVTAGTEYVVSYFTPEGGYFATENYFTGGIAQTPFYTPVNAGVYSYDGGFPAESWHASNYWVTPKFAV